MKKINDLFQKIVFLTCWVGWEERGEIYFLNGVSLRGQIQRKEKEEDEPRRLRAGAWDLSN